MARFLLYSLLLTLLLLASPARSADTLVVLNKEGASAWLLDPHSGEVRARIAVGEGPHEAAVSPDGRLAVVANYGAAADGSSLSVIDVGSGQLLRTIDLSPHLRPHGIVFRPDGERVLVTAETSRSILEIDVMQGGLLKAHPANGDVHMVALESSSGKAYATAIQTGRLCEITVDGPGDPRVLDTGAGTEALALRPHTDEVWIGNNLEHELKIVERDAWKVVDRLSCGLQPIRLAFTIDGRYALATGLISGDLAVIDADARRIERRIGLGDFVLEESDWQGADQDRLRALGPRIMADGARPIGVLAGPDGRFVYVANRGQDNVAVVDTESWEIVRRLPTGPGPDGMAYSRIDPES